MKKISPTAFFGLMQTAAFPILFSIWTRTGEPAGFLLLLFLLFMLMLRARFTRLGGTLFLDAAVSFFVFLVFNGSVEAGALILVMFQGAFQGYWIIYLVGIYFLWIENLYLFLFAAGILLVGTLLRLWGLDREGKKTIRDQYEKKLMEMGDLQEELAHATEKVEQMSVITERARISRDIHDNAGHEIIAAFITFQTVRNYLETENPDVLKLYDTALGRLDNGVDKIREAVHNIGTVTFLGIERLQEICHRYPKLQVELSSSGNMNVISSAIWNVLETVLKESLTNVSRHSQAKTARVELDATPHIVRLSIENERMEEAVEPMGSGLRNLRFRASTLGGNLSVDAGKVFRVICVIPLK